MICALIGMGATVALRTVLAKAGIDAALPMPIVIYLAFATAFSLAVLALMARLDRTVTKKWLGRLIAFLAVAVALVLAVWTLHVLDARPRTHNAHLFAYSAGMAGLLVQAPAKIYTNALPTA